jgi:hypothetical protein
VAALEVTIEKTYLTFVQNVLSINLAFALGAVARCFRPQQAATAKFWAKMAGKSWATVTPKLVS